jgi:hypothetical protein
MQLAEIPNSRPERRRSPRVLADAESRGHLKTTIPVTILNLSLNGLLFELKAPLRPGVVYDLQAHFPGVSVAAMVRITRCRAGGYAPDGRGGRCLLFHAGAEFSELSDPQRANVLLVVERGLGSGPGSPAILRRG